MPIAPRGNKEALLIYENIMSEKNIINKKLKPNKKVKNEKSRIQRKTG